MFYWKNNECNINAIELSQRAVTTVENRLILHSNTSASVACMYERV